MGGVSLGERHLLEVYGYREKRIGKMEGERETEREGEMWRKLRCRQREETL
jgi:hypothetical protein